MFIKDIHIQNIVKNRIPSKEKADNNKEKVNLEQFFYWTDTKTQVNES